jgi:hypothetical protein
MLRIINGNLNAARRNPGRGSVSRDDANRENGVLHSANREIGVPG